MICARVFQNATYEQKDPLLIYKFESFELFSKMLKKINKEVLGIVGRAYIPVQQRQESGNEAEAMAARAAQEARMQQERTRAQMARMQASREADAAQRASQPATSDKKVGRNDPCPCGSGKKYKSCHGAGK